MKRGEEGGEMEEEGEVALHSHEPTMKSAAPPSRGCVGPRKEQGVISSGGSLRGAAGLWGAVARGHGPCRGRGRSCPAAAPRAGSVREPRAAPSRPRLRPEQGPPALPPSPSAPDNPHRPSQGRAAPSSIPQASRPSLRIPLNPARMASLRPPVPSAAWSPRPLRSC